MLFFFSLSAREGGSKPILVFFSTLLSDLSFTLFSLWFFFPFFFWLFVFSPSVGTDCSPHRPNFVPSPILAKS